MWIDGKMKKNICPKKYVTYCGSVDLWRAGKWKMKKKFFEHVVMWTDGKVERWKMER